MSTKLYDFNTEIAYILPVKVAALSFDAVPRNYWPDIIWDDDAPAIIAELGGRHPEWFVASFTGATTHRPWEWEACRATYAQGLLQAEYYDQGLKAWRGFLAELSTFLLMEAQPLLAKFKSGTAADSAVVSAECSRAREQYNSELTRDGVFFWGYPAPGRQCAIAKRLPCGVWVDLSFAVGEDYRAAEAA
jgi:hypothetical protein